MNILYKLERKYGRLAIPNLMVIIVIATAFVYTMELIYPDLGVTELMCLNTRLILRGQVWRLVTFIFIPPAASPLFMVFSLYFYYLIGTTLEKEWGSFVFGAYYFIGVVAIIIASFITGAVGSNTYLNYSLFFAFAVLYPDYEVIVFFVLPVKIKFLAILDAAMFAIMLIIGSVGIKMSVIASLLNLALFFGKDFINWIKRQIEYRKTRQNFRNQTRQWR